MDDAAPTIVENPPASLFAERARLGLDGFDEVWDGTLHLNPPPNNEHSRMNTRLIVALAPICEAAGLELRSELGLIPPEEPGWHDFRVPDITIYRPELGVDRGVIGPAELVIEVRSPGDDSYRKLPFFERLGVGEVLIIDRRTKAVRRWSQTPDGLEGSDGDGVPGRHELSCLPVVLWSDGGRLAVEVDGATTWI